MIYIELPASKNPYFHVAVEDFLVRNLQIEEEDFLLLYENESCVVVGKNQSIYKEVNHVYVRSKEAHVVRRVSGGGTVVHGEGNLCFAFISKFAEEKINNYAYFNTPILKALQNWNIPAEFNHRNDLVCNGKKISGNAQFTNRKNILSHGTLLIHADLEKLKKCLQENSCRVESKAVSSVRSPVVNLQEINSEINSVDQVKNYFLSQLSISKKQLLTEIQLAEIEKLQQEKFETFDWIWGRNPTTHIFENDQEIKIENGLVTSTGLPYF